MLYRPLKDEIVEFGDYVTDDRFGLTKMVPDHCMIGKKVGDADKSGYMHYFRPVPEPCPVEELTNEEKNKILRAYDFFPNAPKIVRIMNAVITSDEIRSRPGETEKEKWVRENMPKHYTIDINLLDKYINDAWDAAIASVRKDK